MINPTKTYDQIGNSDLRYLAEKDSAFGFFLIELYDADDHDHIVLSEETAVALYERLGKDLLAAGLIKETK